MYAELMAFIDQQVSSCTNYFWGEPLFSTRLPPPTAAGGLDPRKADCASESEQGDVARVSGCAAFGAAEALCHSQGAAPVHGTELVQGAENGVRQTVLQKGNVASRHNIVVEFVCKMRVHSHSLVFTVNNECYMQCECTYA